MYNPVKGEREGFISDQYFGGVGLYWGPCFPDGYKSTHFYSQPAKPDVPMLAAGGPFAIDMLTPGSSVSTSISPSTPDSYGSNPDYSMFGNDQDANLKQLPPEVAVQGKNNPMEYWYAKASLLDTTDNADFLQLIGAMCGGRG